MFKFFQDLYSEYLNIKTPLKYEELTKLISDPEIIANQAEWQKLIKEHSSIEEVVQKYREYKKEKQRMDEAKEMMEDKELKELAETDYYEAKENLPHIEDELKALLIPKDPNDDKNIICEIRGGAGGEEAALFAGTLFRMYTMYAEKKHWKLEILNENKRVPLMVDAGLGTPSQAAEAMEMGVDAVLVNTAIATAKDPVAMGEAFALAVKAGRMAYLARLASTSDYARASSPLTDFLFRGEEK